MKYPSVTQVLSPWVDYSRVPPDVLERAADRGRRVHALCASYAQGLWIPEIPEECAPYFESFTRWFDSSVEQVKAVEVELVDTVNGYCGHPDIICKIKGDKGLALPDIKTPQQEMKTWRIQLAAYKQLAITNRYQIDRVFSLRLDSKGGQVKITEYTDSATDFAIFLSALTVWRFMKED